MSAYNLTKFQPDTILQTASKKVVTKISLYESWKFFCIIRSRACILFLWCLNPSHYIEDETRWFMMLKEALFKLVGLSGSYLLQYWDSEKLIFKVYIK